jgi:GNAT superfamily N-acetyltransferase
MSLTSLPRFRIRPATVADIKTLAQILAYSFYVEANPTLHNSWLYPLLCWSIRFDLTNRFAENPASSICLVSEDLVTREAIATIELHFRELDLRQLGLGKLGLGELIFSQFSSVFKTPVKSAYLSSLAVDRKYRRNGIACELINEAETIAKQRGYRAVYLHVIDQNHPARKLYQKLNYLLTKSESNFATWLLGFPNRLLLHKNLN